MAAGGRGTTSGRIWGDAGVGVEFRVEWSGGSGTFTSRAEPRWSPSLSCPPPPPLPPPPHASRMTHSIVGPVVDTSSPGYLGHE